MIHANCGVVRKVGRREPERWNVKHPDGLLFGSPRRGKPCRTWSRSFRLGSRSSRRVPGLPRGILSARLLPPPDRLESGARARSSGVEQPTFRWEPRRETTGWTGVKFGETPSQRGNPEPSPFPGEGVETRRRPPKSRIAGYGEGIVQPTNSADAGAVQAEVGCNRQVEGSIPSGPTNSISMDCDLPRFRNGLDVLWAQGSRIRSEG